MAASRRKRKKPASRRRTTTRDIGPVTMLLPLVLVASFVIAAAFLLSDDDAAPTAASAPSAGLPNTPDYHSLLVAPTDSRHLVLGTHVGLFESRDGGKSWARSGLRDQDAMNLVRTSSSVAWAAGHGMLAKSTDGGETWEPASPSGLPYLDVHGFAVDPSDPQRLYAAIAGQGLYRSNDGGESFELASDRVGADVFGLAVTPSGTVFAGDLRRGVLASDDGGRSWRLSLKQSALGIALNPAKARLLIASTPLGLFRSVTQGRAWDLVFPLAQGAGPLAWSSSDPRLAYAVGFDKRLYRSTDEGATWKAVGGGQ